MTRGKNANRAANRERAVSDREGPLRRRIAQLEAEVERLDLANVAQQAVHNESIVRLRTLIAANTSERLEAAELRIVEVGEERDLARVALEAIQTNWERVVPKMLAYIRATNGHDMTAAVQTFMEYVGQDAESPLLVLDDNEKMVAKKFGATGVAALRRARRNVPVGRPL